MRIWRLRSAAKCRLVANHNMVHNADMATTKCRPVAERCVVHRADMAKR